MGYIGDLKNFVDGEMTQAEYAMLAQEKVSDHDPQYWVAGLYAIACVVGGTVWLASKAAKGVRWCIRKRKAR